MSSIEEVSGRTDAPATTEAHAPPADTTSAPVTEHKEEHHKEEHKPGFLHKVKDALTGVHHHEHAHGEKLDPAAMAPEERTGTNLAEKQELGLTDPHSAEGYGTAANLTAMSGGLGAGMPRAL